MIAASFVLMFISVLLSAAALNSLLRKQAQGTRSVFGVVLLLSAAVHYFFLKPVLSVALSDAPANLLLLIGSWLLILWWRQQGWRLAVGLMVVGLLFGLSVWIRSFNLYPVLIMLLVYAGAWLLRKNRRLAELMIVVALIPIAIQHKAVWDRSGQISYISPGQSSSWTQLHLTDTASGYDTVLPRSGFRYFGNCERDGGLIGAWQNKRFGPYLCLLGNRALFYWQSDLRYTYIQPAAINNLVKYGEKIDQPVYWSKFGLNIHANELISPRGERDAEKNYDG